MGVSESDNKAIAISKLTFVSQSKLDQGESIELSRNYIQISDGTGSKHFK